MAAIALIGGAARASDGRETGVDIAASSLPDAVAELAREAGVSIGTDGVLPRVRTPAIHGRMSVAQVLEILLAGTGYRARRVGVTAWRIERTPAPVARNGNTGTASGSPEKEFPEPVPILVTGAKRNADLLDLPMAVTVIDLTDQQRLGTGSDTALVASEMEGMALTGLGPGRNRMFLRGVADSPFTGESQSTVAVVMDDTRVTYAAPDPDIRLVDMERVEVLKGPQGSLYGVGALGGIYHLVTRAPEYDEASLDTAAGAEIAASGGTGLSGSAVANLPVMPGAVALRLVGYMATEPGWVDTGKRRNSNSSRLSGGRARLGIDPGGGWAIDLTGFTQWLNSRDSRYVYDEHSRSRPAQIPEPHDNDLKLISARVARQGGGADIVLASGMTWHEVGDTLDATIGAEGFGLADPLRLEQSRKYRVWDNEFRISDTWGGVDWLLGVSHVAARQAISSTLYSASDASLVIDDDRRTTFDTAAFGDVTVPLGAGFSLDAGARVYHSVIRETRKLSAGLVTRRHRRSGVTPSFSLSWRPREDRLIFLRYGSAFRQGGADFTAFGEPVTLEGDELKMIEAGWREQLGGRGRLEIGTWYARWNNVQSDMLQADGMIETENVGDAEIFGVEASLELALTPSWGIEAGANYTDAKLVRSDLDIELSDRRLPVVPKYTLRGALRRDFRLGGGDGWIRFKLRYSGPSRLSFDPVLDRPMGEVLETGIEGHARFGGLELALGIENVLGAKANGFSFGNSLRFSRFEQYTPQPPTTLSLTVLRKF